jgi:hypothetical protein
MLESFETLTLRSEPHFRRSLRHRMLVAVNAPALQDRSNRCGCVGETCKAHLSYFKRASQVAWPLVGSKVNTFVIGNKVSFASEVSRRHQRFHQVGPAPAPN